jgi:phosphate transport system permease protein
MNNSSTLSSKDGKDGPVRTLDIVNKSLAKRYQKERRFRVYGKVAVIVSVLFLSLLFISIVKNGYTAFWQTFIEVPVYFDPEILDVDDLATANYSGVVKKSLYKHFPDVTGRTEKRALVGLISSGASYQIRDMVLDTPSLIGKTMSIWLRADDDVDMLIKGHLDERSVGEDGRLKPNQLEWIRSLEKENKVRKQFNWIFFTAGDSREPELAGILGAAMGSFYTIIIAMLLSFPIGVAAAVYLEEFAPTNRWTDIIEVNINNLAAIPSIVFGLLGLAVFLNFFGLPRSAPLVGGLVLTLMTLPTIIIAGRASLTSVPPSIREAALGVGASKMQTVTHHVLPLAMPGMLTGSIIGMAQALGESAPLLMIGMVAFIVDIPGGFTDPSTVLPVQIYLWADSPERAFVERTSAAIMVLLTFLISMNAVAIFLRKKFERRW